MLQMKNPEALRARLIHQVRGVGRTVSCLGFATEHHLGWRLAAVSRPLWFRVAGLGPLHCPWLMGLSWQLQDLKMEASRHPQYPVTPRSQALRVKGCSALT